MQHVQVKGSSAVGSLDHPGYFLAWEVSEGRVPNAQKSKILLQSSFPLEESEERLERGTEKEQWKEIKLVNPFLILTIGLACK